MGLFKCSLNANCGNTMFAQCSFGEMIRRGGDTGRALRLGTEPSRDRRDRGSDRGGQTACKPGSVPRARDTRGWMAIHLGRPSPDASRDLPGRRRGNPPDRNRSAVPTWSCSRWGLPCRPRCRGRGALLPHPFTLTRLRPSRGFGRRFAFCGTFPRVAPAGRYPAPCSRGARTFLPRRRSRAQVPRAAIRPSDHLNT